MTIKNQLYWPPQSTLFQGKPLSRGKIVDGTVHVCACPRQNPTTLNNNDDTNGTYHNPPGDTPWPQVGYPIGLAKLTRAFSPNKYPFLNYFAGPDEPFVPPMGWLFDAPDLNESTVLGFSDPEVSQQWVDPSHDAWLAPIQGLQNTVEGLSPQNWYDAWEYCRRVDGTSTTTNYALSTYCIAQTLPPYADWGGTFFGVDLLNILILHVFANTFQGAYVVGGGPTAAYGVDLGGLAACYPLFRRYATFVYVDSGPMDDYVNGFNLPPPNGYSGGFFGGFADFTAYENAIKFNQRTRYSSTTADEITWVQAAIAGNGIFGGYTPLSTYGWAYKGELDWRTPDTSGILADIKSHFGLS